MSNQQKDIPSSGGTGAGSMSRSDTTSPGGDEQGLRRKEKDDTGGPRGDELSNAVGAAAGDPSKGGASKA